MRVLVALLCVACGSGPTGLTPDTPEPDGPGCEDSDGNGVCDIDLCPDVPGIDLVDPDGDGFGWSCDPVESIVVGHGGFLEAVIADDTFAALASVCTNGTCNRLAVAANARGCAIASATSGDPADAWIVDHIVRGPFVAGGRVIISRDQAGGDVGEFDPSTRSFTSRGAGSFDRAILRGDELVGMTVRTSVGNLGMDLLEPQPTGELLRVATSPGGFVTSSVTASTLQLEGASALIPVRSESPNETFDLKTFTTGAGSLEPTSVVSVDGLSVVGNERIQGYVSATQDAFTYSELTSDGLVSGVVPFIASSVYPLRGWTTTLRLQPHRSDEGSGNYSRR